MMKQALYSFGVVDTYADQVCRAKALGLDGIEFFPQYDMVLPDPEKAKALREVMDREGMGCPCYSMWIAIAGRPLAECAAAVKAHIDIAKLIGSPYMHHTIGPAAYPDQPFSEYLRDAIAFVRETADYAAEQGMTVLIEPQGRMMNGCDRLAEFYAAVERPIGAVLDTGNILTGGNTALEYLERFGPRVRHVHIKDMIYRPTDWPQEQYWEPSLAGGAYRQTPIGHGVLPLREILAKLRALDYRGWYSIEYGAPEPANPYLMRSIETLYRYGRELLGEAGEPVRDPIPVT